MATGVVGASLRDEPWTYPREPASRSVLLGVGGPEPVPTAALLAKAGRRLGQACVRLPEGDVPLNDVLLTSNVARVDQRRPVAAFGSNADPVVLHRTFTDAAVSPVAPMVVASIRNARLAVSAHVSKPGYIPAAAAHSAGGALPVVVAWLDAEQVRCLDGTEPNYAPLVLDNREHPVVCEESGERLSGVTLYDSRWGVLPLVDPEQGQVGVWRQVLTAQPDLAALLRVTPSADDDVLNRAMLRLGDDRALRKAVNALLQPQAVPGGLRGQRNGVAPRYGNCPSRWPAKVLPRDEAALRLRPSRDSVDRRGEVVVCVHPETARRRGLGTHAVLTPGLPTPEEAGLEVLVGVRLDPRVEREVVAADQVARNAVGLELNEPTLLRPAVVAGRGPARLLFGATRSCGSSGSSCCWRCWPPCAAPSSSSGCAPASSTRACTSRTTERARTARPVDRCRHEAS